MAGLLTTIDSLLEETLEQASSGRTLNVGCGWERRPGFLNVDIAALPSVDVVGRLGPGSLPFPDGAFSVILARDVLEHVDTVAALRELHRLTAPGGAVVISAVHFTCRNLYVDPTHVRGFSVRTFDFFVAGGRGGTRSYYFDFAFRSVRSIVQFSALMGKGRYLVWDRLVEPIVNSSPAAQDLYELTFASRLFPAANVLAVLHR